MDQEDEKEESAAEESRLTRRIASSRRSAEEEEQENEVLDLQSEDFAYLDGEEDWLNCSFLTAQPTAYPTSQVPHLKLQDWLEKPFQAFSVSNRKALVNKIDELTASPGKSSFDTRTFSRHKQQPPQRIDIRRGSLFAQRNAFSRGPAFNEDTSPISSSESDLNSETAQSLNQKEASVAFSSNSSLDLNSTFEIGSAEFSPDRTFTAGEKQPQDTNNFNYVQEMARRQEENLKQNFMNRSYVVEDPTISPIYANTKSLKGLMNGGTITKRFLPNPSLPQPANHQNTFTQDHDDDRVNLKSYSTSSLQAPNNTATVTKGYRPLTTAPSTTTYSSGLPMRRELKKPNGSNSMYRVNKNSLNYGSGQNQAPSTQAMRHPLPLNKVGFPELFFD